MPITHKLTLDVRKRAVIGQQRVVVRQGEAGTQQIEAAITKDGEPYASSCTGARLEVLHADGTWARVTAAKSGTGVTVTLPSAAINAPGTCRLAHFVFHTGETTVETTEGFELRILPAVDVSGEQSKPYSDEIEALKAKWAEFEAGARKAEEDRKKAQEKNDAAQKLNDSAAALASQAARDAASGASAQAAAAKSAAQQAQAAARLAKPYHIQDVEPPRPERVQGAMWVQTEGDKVKSINKWDEALPGLGLYPGADTYPRADTYPGQAGDWHRYTV